MSRRVYRDKIDLLIAFDFVISAALFLTFSFMRFYSSTVISCYYFGGEI